MLSTHQASTWILFERVRSEYCNKIPKITKTPMIIACSNEQEK